MQNLIDWKKRICILTMKSQRFFKKFMFAQVKHTSNKKKQLLNNVIEKGIEKTLKNHEQVTPKSIKNASKIHPKINQF